ncbi:MAG: restriction endonuclease subunit S [Chitinophagales bacterium]|nr:restriction endonuclease subunit S [Chitinophagales bacterium]
MSKEAKHTLIPKLRFPEFREAGPWEEKQLGKVSEILRGGSPRPIDNFLTKSPDGLNWLKIGDVDKESKYVAHTEEKVKKSALSKTREVFPGDLIMSNSMSFGRPYILKIKSCIHDGWIAVTKIAANIDRDYLYYIILGDNSQSYFINSAAGGGIKNLNAEIIKLLPVLFPKPSEQQKIAATLTSLDELISAQGEKIKALQAHKKGLMQQLFPAEGEMMPRLRFGEFEGEWESVGLENITHKIMVGIASAATHAYRKSGVILFRNQNIKEGFLDDKEILYIDEDYEKAHRSKRLKAGDLLIARTGYPGIACVVPKKHEGSQSFTTLIARPNSKVIDSTYLCLYINSELGQAFFNSTKIGGGQQNVNAGSLSKMPVPLPSDKEQQKIASFLTSLDDLISAQNQKLEALKTLKKGLMQQLFPNPKEMEV